MALPEQVLWQGQHEGQALGRGTALAPGKSPALVPWPAPGRGDGAAAATPGAGRVTDGSPGQPGPAGFKVTCEAKDVGLRPSLPRSWETPRAPLHRLLTPPRTCGPPREGDRPRVSPLSDSSSSAERGRCSLHPRTPPVAHQHHGAGMGTSSRGTSAAGGGPGGFGSWPVMAAGTAGSAGSGSGEGLAERGFASTPRVPRGILSGMLSVPQHRPGYQPPRRRDEVFLPIPACLGRDDPRQPGGRAAGPSWAGGGRGDPWKSSAAGGKLRQRRARMRPHTWCQRREPRTSFSCYSPSCGHPSMSAHGGGQGAKREQNNIPPALAPPAPRLTAWGARHILNGIPPQSTLRQDTAPAACGSSSLLDPTHWIHRARGGRTCPHHPSAVPAHPAAGPVLSPSSQGSTPEPALSPPQNSAQPPSQCSAPWTSI